MTGIFDTPDYNDEMTAIEDSDYLEVENEKEPEFDVDTENDLREDLRYSED